MGSRFAATFTANTLIQQESVRLEISRFRRRVELADGGVWRQGERERLRKRQALTAKRGQT